MAIINVVKALVPNRLTRLARDLLGITALHARIDRLETALYETKDDTWERSRRRWRNTAPTADLTWGQQTTGNAFIAKAASHGAFGPAKAILEIGPGYGRLLKAILEHSHPFQQYLGVDISAQNIAFLKRSFSSERIEFILGDIEHISLEKKYDVVISSLVLKHLYPSFARALQNVAQHMNANGLFVFDVIEGEKKFFERDNVTFIRQYTKQEVTEILAHARLELKTFDEVRHDFDQVRLLVVATKPTT